MITEKELWSGFWGKDMNLFWKIFLGSPLSVVEMFPVYIKVFICTKMTVSPRRGVSGTCDRRGSGPTYHSYSTHILWIVNFLLLDSNLVHHDYQHSLSLLVTTFSHPQVPVCCFQVKVSWMVTYVCVYL
jgi:hypothetical protein